MSSFYEAEDFDTELISLPEIQDLHTSLIHEDIKMQLLHPFDSKNDFVEQFELQAEELLADEEAEDNPEGIKKINAERIDFYIDVINLIDDQFKLSCDVDTITSNYRVDEIKEICEALYSFFVIKRKKNIKNMMLNYILENRDQICESLDYLRRKKDVTSLETKNKLKDPDLAMMVANLQDVLRYIKSLNIDMNDMIKCVDLELFNNLKVQELMDECIISCNFQELYFSPLFSYQDSNYDDIIAKIEHGIIKVDKKN